MKPRVAVLISGRGSNMTSLLMASRKTGYPANVVLALSNRPDAKGLAHADGAATVVVDHRQFDADRTAHEEAIDAELRRHRIDLVCLAGYMRRLTSTLVDRWTGRMLNIHPSLLPAFPGLHTHERALAAGVKLHGCTVHLVTAELDSGPIVMQAAVPVLPGDDAARLSARVLTQEHLIYPQALAVLAGQQPAWPSPNAALCNPLPAAPPTA